MNIENECQISLRRINKIINRKFSDLKDQIRKDFHAYDRTPKQQVMLTIRDRDHFYAVVSWCNKNIGKGSHYWTVRCSVLKYVDPSKMAYNPPKNALWRIFVSNIDLAPLLTL